jgi:uncharacterized membrane protein (DUF373 family)
MTAPRSPVREWIARGYSLVEDLVYVGLGLLLAVLVVALLVLSAVDLGTNLVARTLPVNVISILDRILLVLLIVELLYTVQVSFREHVLSPEPFLLIGMISAIRRVLLLTTAVGELQHKAVEVPASALIELAVLAALILVLSLSLWLLRRARGTVAAERA